MYYFFKKNIVICDIQIQVKDTRKLLIVQKAADWKLQRKYNHAGP